MISDENTFLRDYNASKQDKFRKDLSLNENQKMKLKRHTHRYRNTIRRKENNYKASYPKQVISEMKITKALLVQRDNRI